MDGPQGEILERDACYELLATQSLGRIALNAPDWPPIIRPVTYALDDSTKSIVFRTGAGTKLTALALNSTASFEVDDVDAATRTAWSVIVTGPAEEVTQAADLRRYEELDLPNWAPGDKPYWIRIRPEQITGRRLHLA